MGLIKYLDKIAAYMEGISQESRCNSAISYAVSTDDFVFALTGENFEKARELARNTNEYLQLSAAEARRARSYANSRSSRGYSLARQLLDMAVEDAGRADGQPAEIGQAYERLVSAQAADARMMHSMEKFDSARRIIEEASQDFQKAYGSVPAFRQVANQLISSLKPAAGR